MKDYWKAIKKENRDFETSIKTEIAEKTTILQVKRYYDPVVNKLDIFKRNIADDFKWSLMLLRLIINDLDF